MNYMAIEYSMWAEEKAYTENGPTARSLILGDSRAKSGLMPNMLSEDTYNMAVGGTTSIEMYYALQNYLAHHESPENIILIFAPYHFCDIDNWNQTLYYNYLSLPEICDVYQNAFRTGNDVILSDGWLTDSLSYRLRLPNKYLAAEYNARFSGRAAENKSKYESVQKDLGYTAFGTDPGNDGGNYETHHEEFDSSALVLDYYDKLLMLCKQNNIQVFIEQSPINQASADVITDEFWRGYEAFMESTSKKYPEFVVEKKVPVYDNRYFGDNNHLNPEGAELFTTDILQKYPGLFK